MAGRAGAILPIALVTEDAQAKKRNTRNLKASTQCRRVRFSSLSSLSLRRQTDAS